MEKQQAERAALTGMVRDQHQAMSKFLEEESTRRNKELEFKTVEAEHMKNLQQVGSYVGASGWV